MITFDLINQGFTFVTNPKSGVTSTQHLLTNILREDFKRHDRLDSSLIVPDKQTAFIFRDPYERVVSMFFRFNRVLWTDPSGTRSAVTLNILKKYGKEEGFNFVEFLTFLRETPNNERDIHYRGQDIPDRRDYVIWTHRYYQDLLSFFDTIGYAKGRDQMAAKTAEDVIANSVKKGVNHRWGDMLGLKTFEFEKFERTGYPPYDLFLNSDTRRTIESIFVEEIEWNYRFSS
jgi:phenolic acid decarboxylase